MNRQTVREVLDVIIILLFTALIMAWVTWMLFHFAVAMAENPELANDVGYVLDGVNDILLSYLD